MDDLKISAEEVTVPGRAYDTGKSRYLSKIASIRPTLLEDQVKLNDPGASQYLLDSLCSGWMERPAALLRG